MSEEASKDGTTITTPFGQHKIASVRVLSKREFGFALNDSPAIDPEGVDKDVKGGAPKMALDDFGGGDDDLDLGDDLGGDGDTNSFACEIVIPWKWLSKHGGSGRRHYFDIGIHSKSADGKGKWIRYWANQHYVDLKDAVLQTHINVGAAGRLEAKPRK